METTLPSTPIATSVENGEIMIPNLRFNEPWQLEILNQINIIANSISIASASIVLIIILTMRIYDHRLVDRVSLRLTAAISLTDMISSSSLLIYNYINNNTSDSACEIAAFLIIWLSNQYIFLSTAIAFNLQWLFLQNRYYNPVFEKWYYIVSVSFSIITAIIPLLGHVLGYDDAQGVCWYTPSYTSSTQFWEYGTYIIPQFICLTYCTIIVLLVIIKLIRDANRTTATNYDDYQGTSIPLPPPSSSQKVVSHVVRRILLYPTTPLLTQLGFIISEIYMFNTLKVSYELNLWGVLTKALPGFFNLVGFLMDPAFMGALRLLKRDLIRRYGDTPSDLQRSSSHRSFDRRSCKIYADHGALDFVMPRNTTCVSLTPLARDHQQSNQKISNNRYMRWFVNRFCKSSVTTTPHINNSITIPSIPTSSSGYTHTTTTTTITPTAAGPVLSEIHNNNKTNNTSSEKTAITTTSSSFSEQLPTFLNSPTVYLIGEDTPYQRHDIIKDYPSITLQQQQQQQEYNNNSNNNNNECFTIPVFFKDQLDEAVPWRVLEASFDEEEQQEENNNDNPEDPYQPYSGSYSNTTGMDSWLELSEPVSPSKMTQWLTKRGDSLEIVRERVARSSKSIRRWCKQQQQQLYQEDQHHEKMDDIIHATTTTTTTTAPDNDSYITTITTTSSTMATTTTTAKQRDSRTLSGCPFDYNNNNNNNNNTFLQSVPESHLESFEQQEKEISRRI